jgi:hypothetical protein
MLVSFDVTTFFVGVVNARASPTAVKKPVVAMTEAATAISVNESSDFRFMAKPGVFFERAITGKRKVPPSR